MLAVSKSTNRKHNRSVLLLILLLIGLALLLVRCKPSSEQMYNAQTTESIAFDQHPWDVEFDEEHIYDMNDSIIYFFEDTIYNETTQGIRMYSVRKDLALQALDQRGSYYMTKAPVVKFEGHTFVRTKKAY